MAIMSDEQLNEFNQACRTLIADKKTLLLATVNPDGIPENSYAPYVQDEQGCFYIFVSQLAGHTRNLQMGTDCSVLFIRDEQESRNLYARERVSFRCAVKQVEAADTRYNGMLDRLEEVQGQTVVMLRSLPDFLLFQLKPTSGNYVVGFGKAFAVSPEDFSLTHIDADRLKGG